MPEACHPTKSWDWYMSEYERKEIKSFLDDKKQYFQTY